MIPRFLTCNTSWLMLPFSYSANTRRGPRCKKTIHSVLDMWRHWEGSHNSLDKKKKKKKIGLKRSLWASLPLEGTWWCGHRKDCLGEALMRRDRAWEGAFQLLEYPSAAQEANRIWLWRWEENQEVQCHRSQRRAVFQAGGGEGGEQLQQHRWELISFKICTQLMTDHLCFASRSVSPIDFYQSFLWI